MEPFLYHGIKRYNLELLEKILKSGYLKPRCELEEGLVTDQNNIFNGTEYISLCQKSLFDGYADDHVRVSYDEFVSGQMCLVFKPGNIKLIFPNMIDLDFLSPQEWAEIKFKDGETRYTYFEDEVQTKEKISLKDNLIAIGLPMEYLRYSYSEDEIQEILDRLHSEMQENGFDVPILDSTKYSFADDYDKINENVIELKGHQR
jgi:hypothetical protein